MARGKTELPKKTSIKNLKRKAEEQPTKPVSIKQSKLVPTKKSKPKSPSPEPSDQEASTSGSPGEEEKEEPWEGVNGGNDDSDNEEGDGGLSTDDDDSSDEDEDMGDEPSLFDVQKLPTIAKDDATVKRKLEKAKRQPAEDRGVIFVGRLPHGFYEDQLRAYFTQFGNVTRLRVSRNKKTGKPKHYGFLEFDSSSVAQIVAETMDNYLLMGHILQCKVIPKEEVHPELWVGANRKWRIVPRSRIVRVEHNKARTDDDQEKAEKRLIRRQNERKQKLEAAGIKYNLDSVGYKKKA